MKPRHLLWLSVGVLALLTALHPSIADTDRPPLAAGGGEYVLRDAGPHISDQQRQRVWAEVVRNAQRLGLDMAPLTAAHIPFAWPLRPADWLTDYGYYGISNFVDHDAAYPDHLLDYNCGDRTYDTSDGYNHRGTDIFPWPFSWSKMNQDAVQVVAAAAGVIVYREDGHPDHNCDFSQGDANAIVLLHADGSATWYWHMKKNSLTSKGVGASVAQGEYLGIVGSSGYSTGPHLHFEVYDGFDASRMEGNLIDPYQGPCNSLNTVSWWASQLPYYDPAITKLTTGSAPPDFPPCPQPEDGHERTVFAPGDTVYYAAYYRDQRADLPSQHRVYRPDGSLFQQWSVNISAEHYAASYWWRAYDLDAQAPSGTWRYQVVFDAQTYTHEFYVANLDQHLYLPLVAR